MATAMILPESKQGKREETSPLNGEVGASQLKYARAVKRLAPELVSPVISGALPLKDAYDKAKEREQAARGESVPTFQGTLKG